MGNGQTWGNQASAFHSLAPGLVAQTRLAGAAACEATEDTFEDLAEPFLVIS